MSNYLLKRRRRLRMKGRGRLISLGRYRYALQALESAWISPETMEAGRRAIKRCVRNVFIWEVPDKLITLVTTKSGLGCLYDIEPGNTLYELSGVSETIARKALTRAASKMSKLPGYIMPIKTQIIYIKSNNQIFYNK